MTDLDPIPLLADLVRINSVNPDLVPGAAGETRIADFCSAWFERNGFEVHRLEAVPGRPSVVGIARGSGGGRSLMFNGHYDTVTVDGYDGDPFDPKTVDGRLLGRGSYDMKGGVAAMMVAAARAARSGLRGDILVACVADEEYASIGTAEVAARFKADAAVVTEPSHFEITVAHKGFVWFDILVKGRAAHGSRPELGIDAIAKAGHALVALEALDKHLRANPSHPRLGSGSVHASLISGGQELSSYPGECLVRLERRTIPGETPQSCEAELRHMLDGITATVENFSYELTRGLDRKPFEVLQSEPIVEAVTRHAAAHLGHAPTLRGEPFWTDCALLQEAGIPCLMFGASGGGAHAIREWADIASVRMLADTLTDVAMEFCG